MVQYRSSDICIGCRFKSSQGQYSLTLLTNPQCCTNSGKKPRKEYHTDSEASELVSKLIHVVYVCL